MNQRTAGDLTRAGLDPVIGQSENDEGARRLLDHLNAYKTLRDMPAKQLVDLALEHLTFDLRSPQSLILDELCTRVHPNWPNEGDDEAPAVEAAASELETMRRDMALFIELWKRAVDAINALKGSTSALPAAANEAMSGLLRSVHECRLRMEEVCDSPPFAEELSEEASRSRGDG